MTDKNQALGAPVDLVLGLVERLRTRPTGDPYLHMLVHEAADEIDRLNSDRLDMALMVYRLIRRMRAAREGRGHAAGDEALAAKALDYLQRKGLQASPLRADAGPNTERSGAERPTGAPS